jgi:hypothetical protein
LFQLATKALCDPIVRFTELHYDRGIKRIEIGVTVLNLLVLAGSEYTWAFIQPIEEAYIPGIRLR